MERVTSNPARVFRQLRQLGTLREGAEADISIFALEEGNFRLTDAHGATRFGRRMLRPVGHSQGRKVAWCGIDTDRATLVRRPFRRPSGRLVQ